MYGADTMQEKGITAHERRSSSNFLINETRETAAFDGKTRSIARERKREKLAVITKS